MRIVVADASPLIWLGSVQQLELLPRFFDAVLVPDQVWDEVMSKPDGPGAAAIAAAGWIERRRVSVDEGQFSESLGSGESAALVLAKQEQAFVLIDDNAGRATAKRMGVVAIGTLGILRDAKIAGIIPSARVVIERLRANGFYVGDAVLAAIFRATGETAD